MGSCQQEEWRAASAPVFRKRCFLVSIATACECLASACVSLQDRSLADWASHVLRVGQAATPAEAGWLDERGQPATGAAADYTLKVWLGVARPA